jgi:hypothetical protein
VYIGVAQTAGLNLDDHLIRTRLGCLPLLDFPLAIDGRDDGCFHSEFFSDGFSDNGFSGGSLLSMLGELKVTQKVQMDHGLRTQSYNPGSFAVQVRGTVDLKIRLLLRPRSAAPTWSVPKVNLC